MPDWRNSADYAYAKKLHIHEWAWEFLRRSEAYIAAWRNFNDNQATDPYAHYKASAKFNLQEPVDPDLPAKEADPSWLDVIDVLLHTGDDEEDDPDIRRILYRPDLDPEMSWAEAYWFDLTKPIDPQVEMVRLLLKISQEIAFEAVPEAKKLLPRGKYQRQQFSRYVRLLDAERSGASLGEMARRLFPKAGDPRRSAKSALRTAKEIADTGYLELLLRPH